MQIFSIQKNVNFKSKLLPESSVKSITEIVSKPKDSIGTKLLEGLLNSGMQVNHEAKDLFIKTKTEIESEFQSVLDNHPMQEKILNIIKKSDVECHKAQLEFLKLIKNIKMSDNDYNYLLRLLSNFPKEPLIAKIWGICLQKGLDIYTLIDSSYAIDKRCAENILNRNLLEKYKTSLHKALLMSRFNSDETEKRILEYVNKYGETSEARIISQFPAGDDAITNSALNLIYKFQNLVNKFNDVYELEIVTKWKRSPLIQKDIEAKNRILDMFGKGADIDRFYYYIPVILHKTDNDNEKIVAKIIQQKDISLSISERIVSMINKKNEEFINDLCVDKSLKIEPNNFPTIIEIFDFLSRNFSKIENLQLSEKINMLDKLQSIPEKIKPIYAKYGYDIDYYISIINKLLGEKVSVVKVPNNIQHRFLSIFLANNNQTTENILKKHDFVQYGKKGIPLKYTRKNFCQNINNILSLITPEEQNIILKHFGLKRGKSYSDGIVNFDGILNNRKFEINNVRDEVQNAANMIAEEIEKFTVKNESIFDDKELKSLFDSIIKGFPEFTAIVGKEQHNTHAYSVDIHTLKVLQSALKNPLYTTLCDKGKTVLKMSVLLHDLGKPFGIRDCNHPDTSAYYADGILERIKLSEDIKSRIIDIVQNHHWFEKYNRGFMSAEDVAVLCRHPEDLKIYQIMSKADLENVNSTFHLGDKSGGAQTQIEFDVYMQEKMKPIDQALNQIYSRHNPVFYTRFTGNGKLFPIKKVKVDNEIVELRVLNLNELPDGTNLEQFGFPPGTTKENVKFLVHMTRPNVANFESVIYLTKNSLEHSTWSASIIKPSNNITYENLEYGFALNAEQANFADAYFENIATGNHKTFETFRDILLGKVFRYEPNKLDINLTREEVQELCKIVLGIGYIPKINQNIVIGNKTITPEQIRKAFCGNSNLYLRDIMLDNLKKEGYEFNDNEYTDLTHYLLTKKYLTQITKPNSKGEPTGLPIRVGKHSIPASTLVNCINNTLERLFDGGHVQSEVIVFNPVPAALIAKAEEIEQCHHDFLVTAKKYKDTIPVIIQKDSEKI